MPSSPRWEDRLALSSINERLFLLVDKNNLCMGKDFRDSYMENISEQKYHLLDLMNFKCFNWHLNFHASLVFS